MSLTTSITDLTAQVTQLIQTVDQQDDVVRAKIAELAAMVPNTYRLFYVDAVNGSDANDGFSPDNALASLEEALIRVPPGGGAEIRLLSDVRIEQQRDLFASILFIVGWNRATDTEARRKITWAGAATNRNDGALPFLSILSNGSLHFQNVELELPKKTAGITADAVIFHWRGGVTVLWDCVVSAAPACDTYLIGPAFGPCWFHAANSSFAAEVAPGQGRLFREVPAGADPNTDWRINTNITQN